MGLGRLGFTGSWGVALPVPVQEDKSLSLQVLVAPALLYGCETWTLTRNMGWRPNSFGTRSLQRILSDH